MVVDSVDTVFSAQGMPTVPPQFHWALGNHPGTAVANLDETANQLEPAPWFQTLIQRPRRPGNSCSDPPRKPHRQYLPMVPQTPPMVIGAQEAIRLNQQVTRNPFRIANSG